MDARKEGFLAPLAKMIFEGVLDWEVPSTPSSGLLAKLPQPDGATLTLRRSEVRLLGEANPDGETVDLESSGVKTSTRRVKFQARTMTGKP